MTFNTDKASSFAFVKLLKEKLGGGSGSSVPDASSTVKGKLLAYAEKVLSPISASTYNAEYLNTTLDDINTSVDSKADTTTVDALTTKIDSKADTTTVDALSDQIASKADTTTVETLSTQLSEKAPINHLSSDTKYGVATTDNYGHVKISDSTPFGKTTTGTVPTTNAIKNYCMATANACFKANNLDWTNIERINIDELFTLDQDAILDKLSSDITINDGLLYRNLNTDLMSFIKPWECWFSLSGKINIADLIKLNSSFISNTPLITVMEYNPLSSYNAASAATLLIPDSINQTTFGGSLVVGATAEQRGIPSYIHIKIDFVMTKFYANV